MTETILTFLSLAAIGCWVIFAVTSAVGVCGMPTLDPSEPAGDGGPPRPLVSVIIAARNEAADIETTILRVLDQERVNLEVIAVDDRSTDGTGAVLDRLADADRRIRVIHLDHLPEGWVGKCHALHVAEGKARGEWILLTDADIRMTPEVIARAFAAAQRESADHICLLPRQRDASLLGKAGMLMLLMGMPDAIRKANRDRQGVALGAFNLVRADALREIGGHAALRMEIVDDHQLGRLLYRGGKRSRGYFAGRDVDMDMARTPAGLVRVMEKNAFAIARYNLLAVTGLVVGLAVPLAGSIAGPIRGGLVGAAAGVSFWCLALPGVLFARRLGWPTAAGLLAPIGLLVALVAMANSTVRTLARGGVRWRDDFYRLDELRRGMVR
ncbi:MAG: glycosyltransferase family 2 protein [Planctomycetota bacterium]